MIKSEPVEDDSTNVQKINISTKEAHEKYNKKILSNDYAGLMIFIKIKIKQVF